MQVQTSTPGPETDSPGGGRGLPDRVCRVLVLGVAYKRDVDDVRRLSTRIEAPHRVGDADLVEHLLGQRRVLPGGDGPRHDVPGEDVEHDVQVVVHPALGSAQLGDVPGPDLPRPGGEQLRDRLDHRPKVGGNPA